MWTEWKSNELNNIKACCYVGEVLLNHLMFADDICVFCPSVRWLQRILDVCQAYAESHGIIFNCNKTVCMTFKPFQSRESPKTCGALQSYNSPGDWVIELSKPSTDSASLVVKIENKNVFRFRWGDFWRWHHKQGMFCKFWPHLTGPGPQHIDPLFSVKVLLKARSKSASEEPWIDLLAYL